MGRRFFHHLSLVGPLVQIITSTTGMMTTRELLLKAWEPEWSINIGCLAALAVYLRWVRAGTWRRLCFVVGLLVMAFALESPLDVLGDSYLFSAHMAEHLLLILVVPPLLLLGLPAADVRTWLRQPRIATLEARLGNPWLAWFLGMGVMTVWHVPVLYNLALAHEQVHIFQHLSFLVTATIFWWPVLHPVPEMRLPEGLAILYLFAAVVENSALGITITFMRVGHYPAYLHPDDDLGALSLIRQGWGLGPAEDQRIGGLLMWIPGCFIYFIAILGLFAHWHSAASDDEDLETVRDRESVPTFEPQHEGLP